jgi:tetratricopeptide (TPR) repeat protein
MNIATKIALIFLFASLHVNTNSLFIESHIVFYISCFAVTLFTCLQRKNKSELKFDWGYIVVALMFIFLSIKIVFQDNPYGTHRIYVILTCWLLFFVFYSLSYNERIINSIFWVIVTVVAMEIVLGFGQIFGWIENNDVNFRLGGAFGNPGAYAGFLGVVAPLILSVTLDYRQNKQDKKTENLYYLLMACFIFTIYMLVVSKSRGAWLACALGCMFVLNHSYSLLRKLNVVIDTVIKKTAVIVSLILFICVGAYTLYHFKADSAFGRILVWKVTAVTHHDNLLFGNGAGFFEANYGKWQSAYFANNVGSEAEHYVADYVTCAYNEFIETWIEQGWIAVLAFIAIFIFALRLKNKTLSPIEIGAKASLYAMLILMCVSYPLKIIQIYLYFVFCLAIVLHASLPKWKCTGFVAQTGKIVIFVIAIFIVSSGLYNLYGYYHLRKGQQYVFSNQLEKGIEEYGKVASILKNDGIFHFYYGSALTMMQRYEASIEELNASILTSSNPNSYILLGNNYKEVGKNEEAKQAYLTAINMIPSKLYPKYLMAKLLISLSEYEEAEGWAREIVATKEKTPTTAAKEIKNEMEQFIKSRNLK